MMKMLHYSDIQIVLQEVPGEISLCFSITGCPLRCEGCHSPFLWKKDSGTLLTDAVFLHTLNQYKGYISCVLFMGGEWEAQELIHKLQLARSYGLSTCLYTGLEAEDLPECLIKELTWLKTGPWMTTRGGLSEESTNQRFVEVASGAVLNHLFQKKK